MAGTFDKRSISYETAQKIVSAAATKAQEIGVPMAIAVRDESGILKAFARMDGAALLAVRIAQQKAWASVSFGLPTHGYFDFIKDDPPLMAGLPQQEDLIVFGGGYPIKLDGQMVGAIGVSGGHYHQDQMVAEAALKAIGAPVD